MRKFNSSDADKELADLRKKASAAQSLDAATTQAVPLGRRTSNQTGERPPSSLYNFLREDFRPSDAQPVLSRGLAQQIKELRKMEADLDDVDFSGYRYDEESELRDKVRGLGAVLQTVDDGGGIGWNEMTEANTPAPVSSGPTVGTFDSDGNMACGTDDLDDFIRQQKRTGGQMAQKSIQGIVKTVTEVSKSVAEMARGESFTIEGPRGHLLASSAKGPVLSVVQSTGRANSSTDSTAPSSSAVVVPSPPRSSKPGTANDKRPAAVNPFGHDIYSVKPGSGGGLASLRPTKAGILPTQTTKRQPTLVTPLARATSTTPAQPAPSAQTAPEILYVHTEYLGDNGISFCPNCRHCIDLGQLLHTQKATKVEQLTCPKCSQLWVDKQAIAEQRALEDDEAEAFRQAVLEWRKNSKGPSETAGQPIAIQASPAAASTGTASQSLSKPGNGVRIPKSIYFMHLYKCVEAAQKSDIFYN